MPKKGNAIPMNEEDKKWQSECDLRTLKDVMEILEDEKRLAAVKEEIGKQKSALEAVEKIDANYLESIGFKKA